MPSTTEWQLLWSSDWHYCQSLRYTAQLDLSYFSSSGDGSRHAEAAQRMLHDVVAQADVVGLLICSSGGTKTGEGGSWGLCPGCIPLCPGRHCLHFNMYVCWITLLFMFCVYGTTQHITSFAPENRILKAFFKFSGVDTPWPPLLEEGATPSPYCTLIQHGFQLCAGLQHRSTCLTTVNSSRTWDVDISGLPTSTRRVSSHGHSHRLATGVSL